jgi:hypothetical protein
MHRQTDRETGQVICHKTYWLNSVHSFHQHELPSSSLHHHELYRTRFNYLLLNHLDILAVVLTSFLPTSRITFSPLSILQYLIWYCFVFILYVRQGQFVRLSSVSLIIIETFLIGFEVLTEVDTKSTIFWDITPCRKICRARNQRKSRCQSEFLVRLIFRPWR